MIFMKIFRLIYFSLDLTIKRAWFA